MSACLSYLFATLLAAADPDLAKLAGLYSRGDYEAAIESADAAIKARAFGEEWYYWKAASEHAVGANADARATIDLGLRRFPDRLRLQLLHHDVCLSLGDRTTASADLSLIIDAVGRAPWRYTDAESLTAYGRAAILNGGDVRQVIESVFEKTAREFPDSSAPLIAIGEVALSKQDFAFAAEVFGKALKVDEQNGAALLGLAQALAPSDPKEAAKLLEQALKRNPRFKPALLVAASEAIDLGAFDAAETAIQQVLDVSAGHPDALAYRAAIAAIEGDVSSYTSTREDALKIDSANPRVDYLIGLKLSRHYRFQDGAKAQRQALLLAPGFSPARTQLAEDLLRLGDETAGWKLAEAAHAADAYDLRMFNLVELKERMSHLETLTRGRFTVRMSPREAGVYGRSVLDFLESAEQTLSRLYEFPLTTPVLVEIFSDANDFDVRTFGVPVSGGHLGVSFGPVITLKSPLAVKGLRANWQSVLWHELTHTLTLAKTQQRIPRWFSEGLSVYGEWKANSSWGFRFSPALKRRIESGKGARLVDLESSFRRASSAEDILCAYVEAGLAVDYLASRYTWSAVLQVLDDLQTGITPEDSLSRHCAPWNQLEEEYREWKAEQARQFGPLVDWAPADLSGPLNSEDGEALAAWVEAHPNSYSGLWELGKQQFSAGNYARAAAAFLKLTQICPELTADPSPYAFLARSYEAAGDREQEIATLTDWTARRGDLLVPRERLLTLYTQLNAWSEVLATADQLLAINPLSETALRSKALALNQLPAGRVATKVGTTNPTIAAANAWQALVALPATDLAEARYNLARALADIDTPAAKREVLLALERAPEYRPALSLLLSLVRRENRLETTGRPPGENSSEN